jgi:tetratricopeptide (TPR) repeat protein
LEYRFDANQVLELRLFKREASRGAPFITRIDNPVSHVVNPDRQESEAEELEQKIGPGSSLPREQRLQIAYRLAGVLQDLGRREKALDIYTMVQRQRGRRDPVLLNRMAILLEEMNAPDEAEAYYLQAMDAAPASTDAPFNLALLLRRRGRLAEAAALADSVVAWEPAPPHLVLRANIANDLKDAALRDELLQRANRSFGTIDGLSEWELSWLLSCAPMLGDQGRVAEVKREQQRRRDRTFVPVGDLPIRKTDS